MSPAWPHNRPPDPPGPKPIAVTTWHRRETVPGDEHNDLVNDTFIEIRDDLEAFNVNRQLLIRLLTEAGYEPQIPEPPTQGDTA